MVLVSQFYLNFWSTAEGICNERSVMYSTGLLNLWLDMKILRQKFSNLGWNASPDTVNWNVTKICSLDLRSTLPWVLKESQLLVLIWWRHPSDWGSACPSEELHLWVRHNRETCGGPSTHPNLRDWDTWPPLRTSRWGASVYSAAF